MTVKTIVNELIDTMVAQDGLEAELDKILDTGQNYADPSAFAQDFANAGALLQQMSDKANHANTITIRLIDALARDLDRTPTMTDLKNAISQEMSCGDC
jgi:hypothetical protein